MEEIEKMIFSTDIGTCMLGIQLFQGLNPGYDTVLGVFDRLPPSIIEGLFMQSFGVDSKQEMYFNIIPIKNRSRTIFIEETNSYWYFKREEYGRDNKNVGI